MATASSAKPTSSMAALLLVLAVVAGTCASGANGNLIKVTVDCPLDVKIYSEGAPGTVVDLVNGVLSDLDISLDTPVDILINGKIYVIAAVDVNTLLNLKGLVTLVITCKSTKTCAYPGTGVPVVATANVLDVVSAKVDLCAKIKL